MPRYNERTTVSTETINDFATSIEATARKLRATVADMENSNMKTIDVLMVDTGQKGIAQISKFEGEVSDAFNNQVASRTIVPLEAKKTLSTKEAKKLVESLENGSTSDTKKNPTKSMPKR
jgi:hypothetical protein